MALLLMAGAPVAGALESAAGIEIGLPSIHTICAICILLVYLAGSTWILLRHRARNQRLASTIGPAHRQLAIAYASQSGTAQQLALRTGKQLDEAGIAAPAIPLNQLKLEQLRGIKKLLLIVSTYGEGEPPDNAAAFASRAMHRPADLSGLEFGILALGDRRYRRFCGFGHAVQHWLRQCGATPLFDPIEVDGGDSGALHRWQHHLGRLSGATDYADWSTPGYESWRLVDRQCLNPGSAGDPIYHLILEPAGGMPLPDWRAGDIAEIGPGNAPGAVADWLTGLDGLTVDERQALALGLVRRHLPEPCERTAWQARLTSGSMTAAAWVASLRLLPHREYSIASLPDSGRLELLVRQMHHPDGQPGLGSGWLTRHIQPGGVVELRIRSNPSFHPPRHDQPLILIGNGTGMAGLRAHLLARKTGGGGRNWLLFGERSATHDALFQAQLQGWLDSGHLQRLDLAFSRDQPEKIYVQHRLLAAAEMLRTWLADGAAIYVCGSLAGMARDVDATLVRLLGADQLEQLAEAGRYRRDVY